MNTKAKSITQKFHNGWSILPILIIVLILNIVAWPKILPYQNSETHSILENLMYYVYLYCIPLIAGGVVYHYVNKQILPCLIVFLITALLIILGISPIVEALTNVLSKDIAISFRKTLEDTFTITFMPVVINIVKDKLK